MTNKRKILAWSGGVISSALGLLMITSGEKFDVIHYKYNFDREGNSYYLPDYQKFYDDMLQTFRDYGCEVTIVNSGKYIKEELYKAYHRSNYKPLNGQIYGINRLQKGNCRYCVPTAKFYDLASSDDCLLYLGVAYHNSESAKYTQKGKNLKNRVYPFLQYDMNKEEILKTFDLREDFPKPPKYEKIGINCYFCPYASKRARDYVRVNYPEYYKRIIDIIDINPTWVDFDIVIKNNYYLELTGLIEHEGTFTENPFTMGYVKTVDGYKEWLKKEGFAHCENNFRKNKEDFLSKQGC